MRATQCRCRDVCRIIHQRRTTLASSAALLVILLFVAEHVEALSMVASSRFGSSRLRVPAAQPSVTSSLVSQLAVVALKLRLQDQSGVKCDVTASSSDLLLKGKVGPVTVKGRGWQSRLGLTCRAIEATVDSCDLDIGRIFNSQKLVLTTPGTLYVYIVPIEYPHETHVSTRCILCMLEFSSWNCNGCS